MNLHHLHLFLTTIEHGNITAAAHALGISQPALSKQLSRLEQDFDTALLKRLPRGVQPTAAGAILADHARSVEASYRSAVRLMDSVKKGGSAQISVGAGYYWLNGFLPQAVAALVSDHPEAQVRIEAGVPEQLIRQLLDGELDLIFGPVAFREGHADVIQAESLLRTDAVVLVRDEHPANDDQNRSIEELSELRWALPQGTFIRKRFNQVFEAHGLTPPAAAVEVNDVSAALDIVAHSDLATLASSVTPRGAHWPGFGRVQCRDLAGWRDSGILSRRNSVTPDLGHALCTHLRGLVLEHEQAVNSANSPTQGFTSHM